MLASAVRIRNFSFSSGFHHQAWVVSHHMRATWGGLGGKITIEWRGEIEYWGDRRSFRSQIILLGGILHNHPFFFFCHQDLKMVPVTFFVVVDTFTLTHHFYIIVGSKTSTLCNILLKMYHERTSASRHGEVTGHNLSSCFKQLKKKNSQNV